MAKAKPNKRTLQGQAPLSLAASQGNAFITQLLVGARAEVNYCPDTSNGVTALYLAAAGNHVNCIGKCWVFLKLYGGGRSMKHFTVGCRCVGL